MMKDRKRKIMYGWIKVFQVFFTTAFYLFTLLSIFNSDIRWINNNGIPTIMGWGFFFSWLGMTICMIIRSIFGKKTFKIIDEKNNEIDRTNKELKEMYKHSVISTSMLDSINKIHRSTLKSLIERLDEQFLKKGYRKIPTKVIKKSRNQLIKMLEELEELVLLYFEKDTPKDNTSKIRLFSSLSYRMPLSDWKAIRGSRNEDFSAQSEYDDKGSNFNQATKADELIFNSKNKYGGITLCYGLKIGSNKHIKSDGKSIIFLEAILLIETRQILLNEKNESDNKSIKDFLQINIFDNYREKLQIELINFFIQEKLESK